MVNIGRRGGGGGAGGGEILGFCQLVGANLGIGCSLGAASGAGIGLTCTALGLTANTGVCATVVKTGNCSRISGTGWFFFQINCVGA